MYSNVRDSKPLPGPGWYLVFNSLSFSQFSIFSGVLPIANPLVVDFSTSRTLGRGAELLRMELKRRKSAAMDFPLLFKSFPFIKHMSHVPAVNFHLLFYSGSFPLCESCIRGVQPRAHSS